MAPFDASPHAHAVSAPEIAAPTAAQPVRGRIGLRRAGLVAAASLATVAALALADPSASLSGDPELTRLLRGMAAVKLAFALPIAGAVWWRLGQPASAPLAAVYVAIVAGAFAALAMVWRLSEPGLASLLFHASLIGFAVTALREPALMVRLGRREAYSSGDLPRPS